MPGLITMNHSEFVDAPTLERYKAVASTLGDIVIRETVVPGESRLDREARKLTGNMPIVISSTAETTDAWKQFHELTRVPEVTEELVHANAV
jgi:hypothetical protein